MRVAILDDEPAELRRVEQTLRQMAEPGEPAWSLHSFEQGEDLLRQLRRETFDLLILDWQLPDFSGLSLLRWTREHMDAPPAAIMLDQPRCRKRYRPGVECGRRRLRQQAVSTQ